MLHGICVALVIAAALAEATALRQWAQRQEQRAAEQMAANIGYRGPAYYASPIVHGAGMNLNTNIP